MDKISVSSLGMPSFVNISKGDLFIKVNPYIDMDIELKLRQAYLTAYFGEDGDYTFAEHSLIANVVQLLTNVDVRPDDLDVIVSSGLYDEIIAHVANYAQFRNRLDVFIKDVKQINSVKIAVRVILGDTIDYMSERIDVFTSPDSIAKLATAFKELAGVVEESPALSALVKKEVQ